MDLELVEVNGNERKIRILSDELSKELHKLVAGGPKPIFIELNAYGDDDCKTIFQILSETNCVKYWLKTNKYESPGWKKYRKGLEDIKVSQDGVLSIGYFVLTRSTSDTKDFYGSIYDNEYSWEYNRYEGLIHHRYDEKIQQTTQTRTSATQAIENTIQKGNIDFTTLKEATMFLGAEDSYLQAWPTDCLHCPEEFEKDPFNAAAYHQTHINKCLWRSDRINDFKDNQIALLKRIINKFNDYKKEAIKKVIQAAQEQGITETELNHTRPGWPDFLRKLTNREQIGDYCANQLGVDIENLVAAKQKSGEAKKQAEKEAKENAEKEQKRLKKEQEEKAQQQQKEEETRIKREQEQAQKEQEKLKKQQEKIIKEEEKRWFWEQLAEEAKQREQAGINQAKQRLEQEKQKATQEAEKNKLKKQQQELEQREQDLKKEEQNNNPNSIILKKFAHLPKFNRQENLEALIEPVKNNPNFLQQLQAKQIPSLTALIVDKSSQEIIITVKRFEYEKEKEKKIRAYYHLNSHDNLTDEQINNYLYREAIGQITSQTESPNNENNGLLIPLIIGGGVLLILFTAVAIIRIKWIKLKKR